MRAIRPILATAVRLVSEGRVLFAAEAPYNIKTSSYA
jgi:hypothetical protein